MAWPAPLNTLSGERRNPSKSGRAPAQGTTGLHPTEDRRDPGVSTVLDDGGVGGVGNDGHSPSARPRGPGAVRGHSDSCGAGGPESPPRRDRSALRAKLSPAEAERPGLRSTTRRPTQFSDRAVAVEKHEGTGSRSRRPLRQLRAERGLAVDMEEIARRRLRRFPSITHRLMRARGSSATTGITS